MKFKIFKFENVTSTNDAAIDMIKKEKRLSGYVYSSSQKKEEERTEMNGFHRKEIFLAHFFSYLKKIIHQLKNLQ